MYYDKVQNIEGAESTVEEKKAVNDSGFSKDIIAKVGAVADKSMTVNLFKKTSVSMKSGMVFALVGVGYALWKRKSIIKYGIGGTVAGLLIGNVFGKSLVDYSNNKKVEDKKTEDEKSEQDS